MITQEEFNGLSVGDKVEIKGYDNRQWIIKKKWNDKSFLVDCEGMQLFVWQYQIESVVKPLPHIEGKVKMCYEPVPKIEKHDIDVIKKTLYLFWKYRKEWDVYCNDDIDSITGVILKHWNEEIK